MNQLPLRNEVPMLVGLAERPEPTILGQGHLYGHSEVTSVIVARTGRNTHRVRLMWYDQTLAVRMLYYYSDDAAECYAMKLSKAYCTKLGKIGF